MASMWKNKDGRTIRRNKIASQFAWQAIEMLESPSYRVLSLSARRVIDRIQIEHAHHGGRENGKLPVTFQDFETYGIHRHAIAPAIREAEALGFIRITQEGRAGNAEWRIPNMFELTHLPTDKEPKPTEDWRRIENLEQAELVAAAARKRPPRFGKIRKKARSEKQSPSAGKRTSLECENHTLRPESVGAETALLSPAETALLSISREESGAAAKSEPKPKPVLKLVWSTPSLTELEWNDEYARLYSSQAAAA
jgi:hypothetical protein